LLINSNDYFAILDDIKNRIKTAQYKAVLGANYEQILLYWSIGKIISGNLKYGNNFIDNLARDIKLDFPKSKGYSARNLRYMRKFAEFITDEQILQTLSAKLSWSHNTYIFDKAKTLEEYIWYAKKTIENGWSVSALEYHVETKDYSRQATAEKASNYDKLLSQPFSGLAQDTLKSPYVFDFVEQRESIIEREIEEELVANIAKTIMELGILLCKERSKLTAEYALKDINKPIGVSEYKLSDFVPEELADTLPSAEDIEKRVKLEFDINEA